ncbi:MAG: hypothetical protein LUQ18_00830 [Methylococcaceae bacterium]|nr:hypothetical protein [Methylococcaceae bacterium]
MNIFSFFGKLFAGESTAQDAHLPLKINFNSTVTFEINPILSAMTHGAMIDVLLDNLKVLRIKSISSIKIDGLENKKIHRFYFNQEGERKRLFLQTLSDSNNVENIDEILFCSSVTEPPTGEEDILFFLGDNESGLGEPSYNFSREDLYTFLSRAEVDKRLAVNGDEDGVTYSRANEEEDFMPAFNGVETVIFDANGTTGESRRIMNLMPHSRSLQNSLFEELIVAFWVTTSHNGKEITIEDQLPLAEYIFAIKLERTNIKVI